jgi:ribonuclease P protein subunit RPR2
MAKKYNKNQAKKVAKAHMANLEEQIDKQRFSNASLAQRYFEMVRRLSRKFRLPISRTLKRQYCKHCHTLLTPGLNSRVRLRKGKRVLYCFKCKNFTRSPYSKK